MKKDYELNAEIRKILAENWVDTGLLYYKSVGQVVILEGVMKKRGGDMTSITPVVMDKIEKALNALPDVKRVRFRLENFAKVDGDWKHMITKMLERKEKHMMFDPAAIKKMLGLAATGPEGGGAPPAKG